MNDVIDRFLKDYEKNFDFYEKVARICHEQCRNVLQQRGIRHLATFRAKDPARLREKLVNRQGDGASYASEEEITSKIADLAGVRVALYFPGDRDRATKLLKTQFELVKEREFPDRTSPRRGAEIYEYRFSGYGATHLRVKLKSEKLGQNESRYTTAIIEIQIASVVMHAWAEVEHDLVYKPLTGNMSKPEYALLDQVNGLAYSEEIALEQLQAAIQSRLASSEKRPFQDQYELRSFISKKLEFPEGSPPDMGRMDILLVLLRYRQVDQPYLLIPFLPPPNGLEKGSLIVNQIVDRVLVSVSNDQERETLATLWQRLTEIEGVATEAPLSPGRAQVEVWAARDRFEKHWRNVERALKQVLEKHEQPRALLDNQALKQIPGISRERIDHIAESKALFHSITQLGKLPPADELKTRTEQLSRILEWVYTVFPEVK